MAKAKAKSINENATTLNTIVELHTEINSLSTTLKDKKELLKEETDFLSAESRKIFNTDLGILGSEVVPDVYGNHEYTVAGRVITVNFKMARGGLTFRQVGGRPAHEVLPELIDEKEYKSLFKEAQVLKESDEKLTEVHESRADLVSFRLDPEKLSDEAMVLLGKRFPEAFTPYVIDDATYIKEISSANVVTEVTTGPSFIDKVAKLSDKSKLKLKDIIRKVLGSKATSAVLVGNTASAE